MDCRPHKEHILLELPRFLSYRALRNSSILNPLAPYTIRSQIRRRDRPSSSWRHPGHICLPSVEPQAGSRRRLLYQQTPLRGCSPFHGSVFQRWRFLGMADMTFLSYGTTILSKRCGTKTPTYSGPITIK